MIETGTPFETILRRGIERGSSVSSELDPEAWISKRLAKHRNPGEPQLQERGDGLWLMVNEHKINGGGIVAIYSDVTEQRHKEKELQSANVEIQHKNQELESLSAKLSKYLSPQVYDSIFSGRQEVKIESARKN